MELLTPINRNYLQVPLLFPVLHSTLQSLTLAIE
jgi:hypothetical protein